MNCRTCETHLPQGAANCPQCGAATPYYYSTAGTAPNDPTVVSSPGMVAQPTVYGSEPSGATPATPYDPPPYEIAQQDPYASPPYQSPYAPYNVAPPPSPQRPGSRIGIIAGVVLLILILIGGGVFAWFEYASASNAAALATTTAHVNATASGAAQNFMVKGTYTILGRTTTTVRQNGSDKIYSMTEQDVDSGDVMGSYTSQFTSIVHPDNTANFSGTSTCTCTVAGKSGTW